MQYVFDSFSSVDYDTLLLVIEYFSIFMTLQDLKGSLLYYDNDSYSLYYVDNVPNFEQLNDEWMGFYKTGYIIKKLSVSVEYFMDLLNYIEPRRRLKYNICENTIELYYQCNSIREHQMLMTKNYRSCDVFLQKYDIKFDELMIAGCLYDTNVVFVFEDTNYILVLDDKKSLDIMSLEQEEIEIFTQNSILNNYMQLGCLKWNHTWYSIPKCYQWIKEKGPTCPCTNQKFDVEYIDEIIEKEKQIHRKLMYCSPFSNNSNVTNFSVSTDNNIMKITIYYNTSSLCFWKFPFHNMNLINDILRNFLSRWIDGIFDCSKQGLYVTCMLKKKYCIFYSKYKDLLWPEDKELCDRMLKFQEEQFMMCS